MGSLGEATLDLRTDHLRFNREIDDAKKKAGGLEARFKSVGASMSTVGRNLLPVSAAIGLIGIGSIKAASDFESSFAGVRKTVNATAEEFAALSQGFRDMAKEIPINVNELNRIGEAAGQLGIKTENILGFTRVMADLGVTTNLSAEQAATSLARLANITGLPQTEFDRLGSTIVELGNTMATTEAEIVDFGLRIAGAGEIAGLTEAEILAIGAAMSSVGIEAAAGGTAVQKVLLGMTQAAAEGGEKLAAFANAAGMSAQQFADAFEKDAAGAFTAFVEGLGTAGDDAFQILADLGLEDERLKRAFLSLANAGDLLADAIDTGTRAFEENTALAEEAAQRYETFASQMTLLKNELQDVAITFGTAMLPAMRDAITAVKPLIGALGEAAKLFADMPAPIRLAALALGAIVTVAAPVLIILGTLASAIGTVTGLLFTNTAALGANAAALGTNAAASGAAAAATSRFSLSLLGKAGLVGATLAASVAVGTLINKYLIGKGAFADFFQWAGVMAPAIKLTAEELETMAQRTSEVATVTADELVPAATDATTKLEELGFSAFELNLLLPPLEKSAKLVVEAFRDLSEVEVDWPKLTPPANVPVLMDTLKRSMERFNVQVPDTNRLLAELNALWESGQVPAKQMAAIIEQQRNELERLGVLTPEVAAALKELGAKTGETGGQFVDFFKNIKTGIPILDSLIGGLGSILGGLGGIFDKLFGGGDGEGGGFFSGIKDLFSGGGSDGGNAFLAGLTGAFGGGSFDPVAGLIAAGLNMIPFVGPILSAFAGPLIAGFKKIFGGLFGGPSAAELAGRDAAASYRDAIRDTLSADVLADVQRLFPDDIKGAAFLASIQQQLISAGVAAEEAGAQARMWAARLFEAEKEGADAVAAVIAQISAATQAAINAVDDVANTSSTLIQRRFATITSAVKALGLTAEQEAIRIERRLSRSAARIAARQGTGGGSGSLSTSNIKPLARGGIVTRPTVALIGEGGPEAVIPLGNNRDSMMLPVVINIGDERIGEVLLDLQSRVLRSRGIA